MYLQMIFSIDAAGLAETLRTLLIKSSRRSGRYKTVVDFDRMLREEHPSLEERMFRIRDSEMKKVSVELS